MSDVMFYVRLNTLLGVPFFDVETSTGTLIGMDRNALMPYGKWDHTYTPGRPDGSQIMPYTSMLHYSMPLNELLRYAASSHWYALDGDCMAWALVDVINACTHATLDMQYCMPEGL